MTENLGFDVPGTPDEQDDAQTDEQASVVLRRLAAPVTMQPKTAMEGPSVQLPTAANPVPSSGHVPDLTVPAEVASKLPDDMEPLPDNLKDSFAELTRLDNLSLTGKAEYLRRRRRNAVAKVAFDLQNGPPAPGPITADEQAAQRNNDPFAAAEQRLAELRAKHPELSIKA